MVAFAMSSPQQLKRKARSYFEKEELPEEMAWVAKLTPLHQRLFAAELKAALDKVQEGEDIQTLREVIESWEATASVDADPTLRSMLHEKRDRKRYTPWEPTRQSRSR